MSASIRILTVDDHPVFRDGLRTLIDRQDDLAVVAEVDGPVRAMQVLRSQDVDLVLVDLSLKTGSGLALVRSIVAEWPSMPILVLSMHDERAYAERAFRAGALGYVMKDQPLSVLVSAIRKVAAGQFAFSPEITNSLLRGQRTEVGSGIAALSDRELDVFEHLGRGIRIRDVGSRLGISPKTVESHVASVKRKLDIRHANELVYRATLWCSLRGD